MSRKSIIIPNTEKLPESEVFPREMDYDESHALAVIEFSDKYNLGITYESIGLKSLTYCSEKWYHEIARLGHVFLRLESELNIVYLPSDISLNQYSWFEEKKKELEDELVNLGLTVIDSEGRVLLSEEPRFSIEADKQMLKLMYKIIDEQSKKARVTKSR